MNPHPMTRPPAGYELISCTAGYGGYPDDTESMLEQASVDLARSWPDPIDAVIVAVYLATGGAPPLRIIVNISVDAKPGDAIALTTDAETGRWIQRPMPSEFEPLIRATQVHVASPTGSTQPLPGNYNPMITPPSPWNILTITGTFGVQKIPIAPFLTGGGCRVTYYNHVTGKQLLLIASVEMWPTVRVDAVAFDMGRNGKKWEPIYWPGAFSLMYEKLQILASNLNDEAATSS